MKHGHWKRLVIFFALFSLMACLFLPSCSFGGASVDLVAKSKSDYVIVYPEEANSLVRSQALYLQKSIRQATQATLSVVSDTTEPAEREILVGLTNREASAVVDTLGVNDYTIRIHCITSCTLPHRRYADCGHLLLFRVR